MLDSSNLFVLVFGLGLASAACPAVNIGYDPNAVTGAGKDLSSHSWEYGTAAEAPLELYDPDLSVFSPNAFPNGRVPSPSQSISSLSFAKPHISTSGNTLVDGDGAAGDPASLGVSAILLGGAYSSAATRQRDHLLNVVPRFANGAISQRESNREAWADFLYMAPPFLAYIAVRGNNVSLLRQAAQQCGYYHDILQTDNSFYKHIIPGPSGNKDTGIWSTGNQQDQLVSWIKQIIDGARNAGRESSSGLLRNYLNDGSWFGETSGTALLAAAVYRMAVLAPGTFNGDYIRWADDNRRAIAAHVNNGILQPAVNPLNWGDRQQYLRGSPEGQSVGSMLYSAWRDCKCVGKC
ncbi:hypothetical protein M409DRAFT_70957 [Zasmidium cellare ATCC 36951]|uniref:Uncharacterized protein n=1 Tax=Zasmidium cellare ATCC 36951 TaxID=1080233 RepID=A0A6A6BXE6_ZASCE|nr:uncharacterized protein M409DRAFT_70957 [Zasmidium cellare ATCC 36951]KAF2159504.1 hypothetical protein M409DRAFT_70957 [Zasmidium cellare ATCC 36951]